MEKYLATKSHTVLASLLEEETHEQNLLCMTLASLIGTSAYSEGIQVASPCASIEEARRKGSFAGAFQVTPSSFEFNGHKFTVHECWREAPPPKSKKPFKCMNGVAFTLEVDGKFPSDLAGKKVAFIPNDAISFQPKTGPVHFLIGLQENDFELQAKNPIGPIPKSGETPVLKFHLEH